MKILMTGFSGLQTGHHSMRSMSRMSVPYYIYLKLKDIEPDTTVEWRAVIPGESLTMYDLIWVNLAGCLSFNAPYSLGGFWALSFKKIPTILFWDDWKIGQTLQHARSFSRWGEKQIFKKIGGKHLYQYADLLLNNKKVSKVISDVAGHFACSDWSEYGYNRAQVVPMFKWGNLELIERMLPITSEQGGVFSIDPSSQVELIKLKRLGVKDRRWCIGTIATYKKWLEKLAPTWPMSVFGSGPLIKIYGGEKLKTEMQLQDEYQKSWGILAPPYNYLGSGWFRTRYLYAANGRSIIYSEPGDVSPCLGKSHGLFLEEIEAMSDSELRNLANSQAHATLLHLTDDQYFTEQIYYIVNNLMGIERGQ